MADFPDPKVSNAYQNVDLCPYCGSPGILGIRTHPKFAIRVGTETGLTGFYAHTRADLAILETAFPDHHGVEDAENAAGPYSSNA